jgi:hypothetical protein
VAVLGLELFRRGRLVQDGSIATLGAGTGIATIAVGDYVDGRGHPDRDGLLSLRTKGFKYFWQIGR